MCQTEKSEKKEKPECIGLIDVLRSGGVEPGGECAGGIQRTTSFPTYRGALDRIGVLENAKRNSVKIIQDCLSQPYSGDDLLRCLRDVAKIFSDTDTVAPENEQNDVAEEPICVNT
jgi:hypothetical protein